MVHHCGSLVVTPQACYSPYNLRQKARRWLPPYFPISFICVQRPSQHSLLCHVENSPPYSKTEKILKQWQQICSLRKYIKKTHRIGWPRTEIGGKRTYCKVGQSWKIATSTNWTRLGEWARGTYLITCEIGPRSTRHVRDLTTFFSVNISS